MVLCHGPIDALTEIKVDEKELWAGSTAGGSLTIDKRDMFGGDSREGGISGQLDFMPGNGAQLPNDYLVSKLGALVPAFRGVASVVLRQMYLSMNPYLKTWAFRAQRIHLRDDGQPQWQDALAQIDVTVYDEDGNPVTVAAMNPAHIIRECLTNRLWGMGYSEGDIDDVSFLAAAQTFFDEKMGMCLLWDTQKSIEDFLKIVQQHIDAALYVDRRTGLFTIKPIRGDYDESSLLVLNPSNVDKIEDFKRPTFGELCTSVTVNYWGYLDNKTASITVQDIALEQEQGEGGNNTTVTYEGFCDPATASRAAQRDLRSLSTPLIACTIYATKVARNLRVGSVFKLTWPDYQIADVVMRVTGIAYGNGKTRRVQIKCVQDVFGYPDDAFIVSPPTGWVDPSGPPAPVVYQQAFEMPYFELVREGGQMTVDSQIATNPYIGYVGAAASQPPSVNVINANVWTDDGSGYEDVSTLEFCAGAILVDPISYLDTVLNLSGLQSAALIAANEWVQVDGELMAVVSLVGNVLTVKRGVLDTVPHEHDAGALVLAWDGLAGIDPTEYVASDIVNVKITPVNGSGVVPLGDAVAMPVNIVGRAAMPFAPGNIKFNGQYFPETIGHSDGVLITWATRNRIIQTGGTLLGFTDASVIAEENASVRIKVFGEDDVLGYTNEFTGLSFDFSTAFELEHMPVVVGTVTPADPDYLKVSALLHFDGADDSTTITNKAPTGFSVSGAAKISTDAFKFGGSSLEILSGRVTAASNSPFMVDSADFTIEAWVNPDAEHNGDRTIFSRWGASGNSYIFLIGQSPYNNQLCFFYTTNGSAAVFIRGGTVERNKWSHVAVSKIGTTLRLFIDGIVVETTTVSGTIFNGTLPAHIGNTDNNTAQFVGFIDEFRFTNNLGRYSANFIPANTHFAYDIDEGTTELRLNNSLRFEITSVRGDLESFQGYDVSIVRAP